jgi:hypothetical protein
MFITTFQRKPVRGKMQWVCEDSSYVSAGSAEWWKEGLAEGRPFIAYNLIRRVLAVTDKQVNLGSCKRPHHYIWSMS